MNSIVYPGVEIGTDSHIGAYAIIGEPAAADLPPTRIGPGAVVRSHTVVYAGNVIGAHFTTGHGALIREANTIGDNVSIGSHAIVEHHVTIGNNVRIHSGAFIPEFSMLEDDAWIGPNVVFTNALHPLCPKAKDCLKGPTIRRGAKIGANATLVPDIEIGERALIGAGAVVTTDIPAGAVAAGNPARILKTIDDLRCPYDLIDHPYAPLEVR